MTPIPFRRDDALSPGEVQTLSPGLRRVLCDNPGPFTFRGTNAWIIGPAGQGDAVAILDPGPDDEPHRAALLRATARQRVVAVLVSHTHRDHSPGAAPLAARVNDGAGAPTMAFSPHLTPPGEGGEGGDHAFAPDHRLPDGATVEGDGWRLTALHTPGHCANHLCFALDADPALAAPGALLSADHAMTWSTSVVSPPDGDMADYMRALDRLIALNPTLLLPGHGPAMEDPTPYLHALAAHRRARESAILDALRAAGPSTPAALVPAVYGPALDPRLAPAAARSLLAHLLKSVGDGTATRDGDAFEAR